ncbi:SDR family oxidoreductase [Aureivirga sp. CE67]|uniref:SDR family oxidoreductase n=1 Tax=Aureivirga sp. CE67 TaxID=1788983 RepID=UPI0018CAC1C2|nr:SDR family oxidoreductase [Aureivirga sp. CE67]
MNKTIFITGASSGIGFALCMKMIRKGFNVVGVARRVEKLAELNNHYSNHFLGVYADVTDIDSIKEAISLGIDKFGKIDILINNAGIGIIGPVGENSLEDWNTMIDVNVKGVMNVTNLLLPQLIQNKGHIITIDSIAAHEVFPGSVVYCASKHAAKAFTTGLEKELRGKVRVTKISPGYVNTEFKNHLKYKEYSDKMKASFENGLNPDTIADAIYFAINQDSNVAINEIMIRPFDNQE